MVVKSEIYFQKVMMQNEYFQKSLKTLKKRVSYVFMKSNKNILRKAGFDITLRK